MKVGGFAAIMNKTFATALTGEGKQANHAFGVMEITPIPACGGTSPKGKHVTGFSVVYDSLRIQFLCHPGGGKF